MHAVFSLVIIIFSEQYGLAILRLHFEYTRIAQISERYCRLLKPHFFWLEKNVTNKE